ncbi:MAG TPA: hypothetical protein DCE71_04880 [Parachlamydiales bacterium]|nr:hypothetical protein [Parachlamydiales bacterium]
MGRFFLVCFFCCFAGVLHADDWNERFEEFFISYLIPRDHPLRGWLDSVFCSFDVLNSEETLRGAGFQILSSVPLHPAVLRHPQAPGYVFKLYFNGEKKKPRDGILGVEWLLRRCVEADKLRRWIQKHKIRHFIVPEKWLYPLSHGERHPAVLVAVDMELESYEMNIQAWKTLVSQEHLDELYLILKEGYGSIYLTGNIPYTKRGKFAFVDTEKPKQKHDLTKVKPYLSEKMQKYWDELIR